MNVDAERAAILKTDKEWAAAASEGRDVERIVSFWADDAAVFPPGSPALVGKQAIRDFVAKSLQTSGFSITWETTQVTISPAGDFAYASGTNRVTFDDSEGNRVTLPGKGVTVWRKEPGGGWKCVIDIWNEVPPAGP